MSYGGPCLVANLFILAEGEYKKPLSPFHGYKLFVHIMWSPSVLPAKPIKSFIGVVILLLPQHNPEGIKPTTTAGHGPAFQLLSTIAPLSSCKCTFICSAGPNHGIAAPKRKATQSKYKCPHYHFFNLSELTGLDPFSIHLHNCRSNRWVLFFITKLQKNIGMQFPHNIKRHKRIHPLNIKHNLQSRVNGDTREDMVIIIILSVFIRPPMDIVICRYI